MALLPDARHRNSLGLEPAHQLEGAAPFSSVLECVVVVIELRVGIGLVGEPERLREVVLTEYREPRRPSQRAVVVQRLVDHVPAADPAPERPTTVWIWSRSRWRSVSRLTGWPLESWTTQRGVCLCHTSVWPTMNIRWRSPNATYWSAAVKS